MSAPSILDGRVCVGFECQSYYEKVRTSVVLVLAAAATDNEIISS